MKFDEVIGQEDIKQRLVQMVAEDRIPHALMFCGPSGSGKMALALAFASYLLCRNHNGNNDSCGTCNQCAMLKKLEHPDLHFTFPVIKTKAMSSDHKPISDDFIKEWHNMLNQGPYFNIEQWFDYMGVENQQAVITVGESDELMHKLSMKSSQGGYKVSLIWLPERMNMECANKLLKLFEEPPQQTVFLLICEEPEKLLATIISRTQRIDVKSLDTGTIRKALIEKRKISDDAANNISRIANGSWLKALDCLSTDNNNALFLDMFILLMRLSYSRNILEIKKWCDQAASFGREKQKKFLEYSQRLIRENFIFNFQNPSLNYMTEDEAAFSSRFARFINERNVIGISEELGKAQRDIEQNANSKIVFFDFALKIILLIR
jgi:DNA polymerase-3 subunit delta'